MHRKCYFVVNSEYTDNPHIDDIFKAETYSQCEEFIKNEPNEKRLFIKKVWDLEDA